ncbi:Tm-1-like ATP-binding domain-containing protein [Salinisphaera aquimarina]|uniref:UPF0261 protein ACFOSU_08345 n=1 Tax=Salinisphaera aquimarina TaxID=2094031 RepID=A0ABV7EPX8_9GAMM
MAKAGTVYIVGTGDTKSDELRFVRDRIADADMATCLVDVSTLERSHSADFDVVPKTVADCHPAGADAVFTGDRGQSIAAMAIALRQFIAGRDDLAGIIGLGGSGGTALITPTMRELAIGVPKVMVSTVASGNVGAYVGPTDICMMYSVTDVAGVNPISRVIFANAAHAIAGMARDYQPIDAQPSDGRRAIGLSMFGVTTSCVNQVVERLDPQYDCIVFHATGTGGQSMEKLAESSLFAGVLDITTTEVCDLFMGGIFACTDDRFGVIARTQIPYVGSCGALDMVNFAARDTVPPHYSDRNLYEHNAQITLMRTTAEENARMGRWIGEKLNACDGDLRFLIPEKGVSALDAPGMAFHDPEADAALFGALEDTVKQTSKRRLIRHPLHINDPEFADALVAEFKSVTNET